MSVILETKSIDKYFFEPKEIQVLKNVSFQLEKGQFTSIMGKSGCGKSTLLYILSTMDTEYDGELYIDNELITGQEDAELAHIRNAKIGFVFQFHYLLNEFDVLKNVMLPGIKLGNRSLEEIEHDAYESLKRLGIEEHALKKANQLSGGQKQRVAIARALINDPAIIMADEPTGNLDNTNSDLVFDIFTELAKTYNQSLLVVTHDQDFADRTDRIIEMSDGEIISQG